MKPSLLFLTITTLLLLLILSNPSSSSSSSDNDQVFEAWCKQYNKSYTSEDEKIFRRNGFHHNLDAINAHNNMGLSYEVSLNSFADMTHIEFHESRLGFRLVFDFNIFAKKKYFEEDGDVPSEIDWRKKGAVTDVKDQGSCGASWAFSAIGAIEGINKIKTGRLISLSEQELIDCNKRDTTRDCGRGQVSDAFQFVVENNGINTDVDYPYQARIMACDHEKASVSVMTIDSFEYVPIYNEDQLLQAVARQPVSALIPAGCFGFQFYSKGIFTDLCSALVDFYSMEELDHVVLIVGYGSENGVGYWILKNSWGKNWGMNGYMYLRRNQKGHNGINLIGLYPVKGSENPPVNCDALWKCRGRETCCCWISFSDECKAWTCCDKLGVCCDDRIHCCPSDHPICETKRKLCLQTYGNSSVKAFESSGSVAVSRGKFTGVEKPWEFEIPSLNYTLFDE